MPMTDPDMEAFQAELLEAVRDMKADRAARKAQVQLPAEPPEADAAKKNSTVPAQGSHN